eukprot:3861722-Amphidinium_carterae.1
MKRTQELNCSFKRLPEHGVKVGRREAALVGANVFLHASVVRDVEHCSEGVQLGPCTCAMQGGIAATGEAPRETG